MNIRQDYSFLFSNTNGSNQNNIFYGINLADYATIKSGSYAKLLRSYYREMASGTDNHNNKVDKDKSHAVNHTVNHTQTGPTVDSGKVQEINGLQKSVDELQSSANRLSKKGGASLFREEYTDADKEALFNAVSDFVSDYNALVEKGGASSFSSIASMSGRMNDTAGDHQQALGEIGISLNKGKLSVNKEAFMNADMEKVKEVFHETNSFGYFVSRRTDNIESAIDNVARQNHITIEAVKEENSSGGGSTEKQETSVNHVLKQEMTNMQKYADELGNAADALLRTGESSLFKEEYLAEDKEALYTAVSDFVSDFNTVLEKGSASTVSSIIGMTGRLKDSADDHAQMLKEIGISVGEKALTVDKEAFLNADMEQVKELFNEKNSFGYFTADRAESIELTANNEANRNNLYTQEGVYNNASAGTLYTGTV
ncbi:MAG: hypothetical protein IJC59_06005 [Lachnospiraceae bacterium]|nr:hypothetical protein [Lachnospiraceae bacterium]